MSIRSLFVNRSKKTSSSSPQRRLRHEPLEERQLLAVYSSGDEMPLADPGTVTAEIVVDDTGLIKDLNIELTIEHTKAEDLDIYLIAPDTTRIELFTDVGGRGDDFIGTMLDDDATTSITSATTPFTGVYRPEGDLSALEGKSVAGIWTLEVTDDKRRNTGALKSWAISVETTSELPSGDFLDTNPLMLGDVRSGNDEKDLVVSDNGDAMAVWVESQGSGDSGPLRAMAAEYDVATDTWGEPVIISEATSSYDIQNWLNLAGDGQGNYIATWQQASNATFSLIWINRYVEGVGWQTPEIIGSGTDSVWDPEIAMAYDPSTEETKAVVAWGYRDTFDVYIRRLTDFANGTWSATEVAADVTDDIKPTVTRVDMADNGDFMIVFQTQNAAEDLYYSHYDWDAGWTVQNDALENRPERALSPQVVMNASGIAMVSWFQLTSEEGLSERWARRWNGTGWDTPEPELVADRPIGTITTGLSVAISASGEAVMLWGQQRDGAEFRDAYVRHHDGTEWATIDGVPDIIKIDVEDLGGVGDGTSFRSMGVAMDDTGNAVATWTQSDGTDVNLWTTRFVRDDLAWATAVKIENAPWDAMSLDVDMNGAGDAQVLWNQSDGITNHIFASTIPVTGNLLPTAVSDTATTTEDTSVVIDKAMLLLNDIDPEMDLLSIIGFGTPDNGSLVDNGDGTVTYTPGPDFNGADTFTYTISDGNGGTDTATVTIDVTPVADAPVAVDDAASTNVDTAVLIDLLGNDTDPDGDLISIASLGTASNGTVVDNGDGTVMYTPTGGFVGLDSFAYVVSDGNGGMDTATVAVDVQAVPTELIFISTGEQLPIGDRKTVSSPIVVSGTGVDIVRLTININLTHANPSDLTAWLVSPTGSTLTISEPILSGDYGHAYVIPGAAGLGLDGTWTLQVRDSVRNKKKGTLIEWTMIAEPAVQTIAADQALAMMALDSLEDALEEDPLDGPNLADLALMGM